MLHWAQLVHFSERAGIDDQFLLTVDADVMSTFPKRNNYELVGTWPSKATSWPRNEVAGVAVDHDDNVYLYVRGPQPVRVFDSNGNPIAAWGDGLFKRPHGIAVHGDTVFCVDDWGHAVFILKKDGEIQGKLVRTESELWQSIDPDRPDTISQSGPPFNYPTGVARAPTGELYVSDGYGNARVHRFDGRGNLLQSWGSPGSGPSQFVVPHGVAVDAKGRVYISDRLNKRVQIFSSDGLFITQWEARWPNNVAFDADGRAYVAEMGCVFLFGPNANLDCLPARVTVRDSDGRVLEELNDEHQPELNRYFAPHGIAVDSRGDLYVSEVPDSYTFGQAPSDWPVIRKFRRA
jgi:DNA-binding beta-propeller fold protein YncE